jgi:hypothetical protein
MSIISLCRLGEWVKVVNDSFCIVHPALTYNFWWPHWYRQPFLSIVFLLYPVGQFYFLEKQEYYMFVKKDQLAIVVVIDW